MVRDGLTNITKVEFLSIITQVRRQTFKEATIFAAFRKTGIWPFDPKIVLDKVHERQAKRTPTPPPERADIFSSSPISTPVTLRHINKMAGKITTALSHDPSLDQGLVEVLDRFIRGSLTAATELIQVKRDLRRTKLAEKTWQARRQQKNRPLQSGGVLTVARARHIVRQREENEVEKAEVALQAAKRKERNAFKKWFEEAAKLARRWRFDGTLPAAEVWQSFGGKARKSMLRRP